MKGVYYQISDEEQVFFSLRDAKHHIYIAYTSDERAKLLNGSSIVKYINGDAVTETPIYVDSCGKYKFGKTVRL